MQKDLTIEILKTAGKTVFYIINFLFFFIAVFSVIYPSGMIKFYNQLGLNYAEANMYERVYDNTKKDEDLYNVIQINIKNNNYSNSSRYIYKMLNNSHLNEFSDVINKRNTANVNKKYYVYVCDYKAYLENEYIKALYFSGKKDRAKDLALIELGGNEYNYSWEFGTYIDCIMTDKTLTESEKNSALRDIYNTKINNVSIQEMLNNNLDMIDYVDSKVSFENLKLIHKMISIKVTNKVLAIANNDTVLVDGLVADITNLVAKYNSMLSNL